MALRNLLKPRYGARGYGRNAYGGVPLIPHDNAKCPYVEAYGTCIYEATTGKHKHPGDYVVVTRGKA